MLAFEFLLWFVIPMLFELLLLYFSIRQAVKHPRLQQRILMGTTILLLLLSGYMLVMIFFFNAWPTYMPYYLILGAGLILVAQIALKKRS